MCGRSTRRLSGYRQSSSFSKILETDQNRLLPRIYYDDYPPPCPVNVHLRFASKLNLVILGLAGKTVEVPGRGIIYGFSARKIKMRDGSNRTPSRIEFIEAKLLFLR